MFYYLAPHAGVGTIQDPYRPDCIGADGADVADGTGGWIDLAPLDATLVGLPGRADGPSRLYLGDGPTAVIPPGIKSRLASRLGITLDSSTIKDVVAEVLIVRGGPGKWPKLGKECTSNRFRIWCGGRAPLYEASAIGGSCHLWEEMVAECREWLSRGGSFGAFLHRYGLGVSEAVALVGALRPIRGAAPIIDHFTTDTIGNYTQRNVSTWSISGGLLHNTAGSDPRFIHHNTPLANQDHYVQIKAVANATYKGPACRISTSAQQFFVALQQSTGNSTLQLFRQNSGYTGPLTSGASDPAGPPDYKVQADGTTLKQYRNGVQVGSNVTDTNFNDTSHVNGGASNGNAATDYDDLEMDVLRPAAAPATVSARQQIESLLM